MFEKLTLQLNSLAENRCKMDSVLRDAGVVLQIPGTMHPLVQSDG